MADRASRGGVARRCLVVGASRGIGAAVAAHLVAQGAQVVSASRTAAASGEWVEADVTTDAGLDAIVEAVGDGPLDALLYMGGIWEAGAFTSAYSFAASPREETRSVLAVNLVAPILLAQGLAARLAPEPARPGRIVLMGSLSGLDNLAPVEVANTASKFGLRGAAQALATCLAPIGVTLINPGNIATPEVLEDIATGAFSPQLPIPLNDILRTVDYVLGCDPATAPQEINLFQTRMG